MNIRFADRAVRCRVTRAELDRLLSGRAVALEVPLPRNHVFRVNVRPTALDEWQLDSDPTGIWLSIPRAHIEQLAGSLPGKEGMTESFATADGGRVAVSFQVDLRDKAGRPRAG